MATPFHSLATRMAVVGIAAITVFTSLGVAVSVTEWRVASTVTIGGDGLDLEGTRLYVASSFGMLWMFDVANPRDPRAIAYWVGPSLDRAFVRVAGTYAYYATGSGLLRVFDVELARLGVAAPVLVSTISIPERTSPEDALHLDPVDLEVGDNLVLVSGAEDSTQRRKGIAVGVDVSNPQAPSEMFRIETDSPIRDAHLEGTVAFLATETGVLELWQTSPQVARLADVAMPSLGGTVSALNAVTVDNDLVFVATDRHLIALDLAGTPTVLSSLEAPARPFRVVAAGGYVFMSMRPNQAGESYIARVSVDNKGVLRLDSIITIHHQGAFLAVTPDGRRIFSLRHVLTVVQEETSPLLFASALYQLLWAVSLVAFAPFIILTARRMVGRDARRPEREQGT